MLFTKNTTMEQAKQILENYLAGSETLINTEKFMKKIKISFTLVRGQGVIKAYLRSGNQNQMIKL